MLTERPDYFTARPIGTGRSNPADVRRLRSALSRKGYGPFPARGRPRLTPGLVEGVKSFQRDHGLEADGLILPGGPTEAALNDEVAALNRGYGFESVAAQGPDETQVAIAPALAYAIMWGAPILLGGAALYTQKDLLKRLERRSEPAPFSARGQEDGGNTRRSTLRPHKSLGALPGSPVPDPLPPTPPFPAHRPEPTIITGPAPIPQKPTILVHPVPDLRLPGILIYPDQSDLARKLRLHIYESRGTADGQQKWVDIIIDEIYALLEEYGLLKLVRHVNGGTMAPDPKTGKRKYLKEHYLPGPGGGRKGSSRSDITYRILHKLLHINVVDSLADGRHMTKREGGGFFGLFLNNKRSGNEGKVWIIVKPRYITEEEFRKRARELARAIVKYAIYDLDKLDMKRPKTKK